jgi:hypothetical protein
MEICPQPNLSRGDKSEIEQIAEKFLQEARRGSYGAVFLCGVTTDGNIFMKAYHVPSQYVMPLVGHTYCVLNEITQNRSLLCPPESPVTLSS